MQTLARFMLLAAGVLSGALVSLAPQAHAQGGLSLWTNRSGLNPVVTSPSGSPTIATDRSGNLFMTGTTRGSNGDVDIAVLSLSGAGVPRWTNSYAGPWSGNDGPQAIAVDGQGNVFVAGFSAIGGTDWDFVTLAYSNTGEPLWTNYYNGPGNDLDRARAIAVDGAGNVFVTGWSKDENGLVGYATVAYSGVGVPMWTNRYKGPGPGGDWVATIAVDTVGNVFVTGQSSSVNWPTYDYTTVAYSGSGLPLWTNRYNGSGTGSDSANAIAVDRNGNVFVTGSSIGNRGDLDFATVAYSGAGVALWTNRYNGLGNTNDSANAIAVDKDGNVFVTGSSWRGSSSSSSDYTTIAYSGAGVPLWTNRYNGPGNNFDEPRAIAVDSAGNVFVTGWSWRGTVSTSGDFATVAYSGAGVPLWTNRYNGPLNDDDEADAIAVDIRGNVFVAGSSTGVGAVTIKYSSSVQPRLDIQSFSNQVVLSWNTPGFSLLAAPTIMGTFTNIAGATSPYTNSANGSERYFRLSSP